MNKIFKLINSLAELLASMSDLVDSLRLMGSLLLQVVPTLL
jgi:hypothetical protein